MSSRRINTESTFAQDQTNSLWSHSQLAVGRDAGAEPGQIQIASLRERVSDGGGRGRGEVSRDDDHGHDDGPGYFPHDQFSDAVLRADIPGGTSTTTTLRPGGSLTAAIETRGDHDWFRVELTAGQTYVFNTGAGSGGAIDTTLALRNAGGQTITSNDDANGGTLSQITFTASSTGVYYLDVGTYQNRTTGQYSVSMTAQGAPPPTGRPVFTNDQIANQLTDGFWGGNDRSFNVGPGGR